mmetsp:Transcript_87237/g.182574  ORF Transcript_87237/g.182574 Transcript_87237/m.182574 type:complete len:291 (-) Transcript_87237:153-1025(-)
MSIPSDGMPPQTWKAYAGRTDGKDGYVFGDFVRHWWLLIRGSDTPTRPTNALVDESDCALLDLKVQRDQLIGHQKRVEKLLLKDEEVARALVASGKREQAMLALRKKKQHLQLVSDCGGHILKVEELIGNIETTRAQQEMVEALKTGVAQLKRMQREIGGAAEVQRLMDEHEELSDEMREMSELLARSGVASDDAEALAEFRKLEEEVALKASLQAAETPPGAATAADPAAAPAPVPAPASAPVTPDVDANVDSPAPPATSQASPAQAQSQPAGIAAAPQARLQRQAVPA